MYKEHSFEFYIREKLFINYFLKRYKQIFTTTKFCDKIYL